MREETNEQQNRVSTSLFVVNLDTIQNFKAENLTTMLLILAFQNKGFICYLMDPWVKQDYLCHNSSKLI